MYWIRKIILCSQYLNSTLARVSAHQARNFRNFMRAFRKKRAAIFHFYSRFSTYILHAVTVLNRLCFLSSCMISKIDAWILWKKRFWKISNFFSVCRLTSKLHTNTKFLKLHTCTLQAEWKSAEKWRENILETF